MEVSYGSQCPVQMRWLKRVSLSSLSSDAWCFFLQRLALKGGTFAWEEGSSAHVKNDFCFCFFFPESARNFIIKFAGIGII